MFKSLSSADTLASRVPQEKPSKYGQITNFAGSRVTVKRYLFKCAVGILTLSLLMRLKNVIFECE
jgi:hypothetical protein